MGISPQPKSQWVTVALSLSITTLAAVAVHFWTKKSKSNSSAKTKIQQLEASLKSALQNCAAERQGRIRAQQELRDALSKRNNDDNLDSSTYPMAPIGVVRSCFSTRNGTPRQPLLVPLAKASLVLDPKRVPEASLEGLGAYSHCWVIFVFHLNTDLDKLWKHPSKAKLKAKVRIPRLNGERMGVFATRTPHRPCPIGLTVAKVEEVRGHNVLLSGVDLVDGTPILDVKPYLPYCDNISGATVPDWVKVDDVLGIASVDFSEGFSSSLADSWPLVEKKSLCASSDEFQMLLKQVLSYDIRSVSQRIRPHISTIEALDLISKDDDEPESILEDTAVENGGTLVSSVSNDVVYHLILDHLDVSYTIDSDSNVHVERADVTSHARRRDNIVK